MRLSGWRVRAPNRDGINPKVIETVGTILTGLGAEADPHGWLIWGDETGGRWSFMAPCPAGLAVVNVRAGSPQEGPRASGRLVRWTKVQVGELAVETERGHRLVMFQVEGQPIRATDDQADEVARFAGLVLAGIDGRPLPELDGGPVRRPSGSGARSGSGKPGPTQSRAAKAGPVAPKPRPAPASSVPRLGPG
jgi:hypothetical protein